MTQSLNGSQRQRPRLVESSLPVFRSVKRHRYDQHLLRRIRHQSRHRLRKHRSQLLRSRMQTAILQCVNRLSQASIVSRKRHSLCERRRRYPASTTHIARLNPFYDRCIQRVSASQAHNPGLGRYLSPASITNWNGRESWQRGAAKCTAGRKKCGTYCVNRTSENTHYRAPTGCLR